MERENSMLFLFIIKKNFNILLNYLTRKEKTKNDDYKSTLTKEIPGACSALFSLLLPSAPPADLCPAWALKCPSPSCGGQRTVLALGLSPAVMRNLSCREVLVPPAGMFLGHSPRQPILSLAHERGSFISCFSCLLIIWDSLFFPLTHRHRNSGLERGSPAVSVK